MTPLRVFMDSLPLSAWLTAARGPLSVTVLSPAALKRAGLLMVEELERARYLAPMLSGYGDFSVYVTERTMRDGVDVHDWVKRARADSLRAVWTMADAPGSLVFRNRYCDRLTVGYVNTAPLDDLHRLVWAGVAENIGCLNGGLHAAV